METVYKSEQVYLISEKLGLSQKDVKRILDNYVGRVISKINKGESVKFLNICYFVFDESRVRYHETLAYISSEIGSELKIGKEVVYRVLSEFDNFVATDLKKFYSYTVRGLFSIGLEEYKKGIYKVRVRKSSSLRDIGVRIVTINSFKRKVE